ncbi:CBO0543 family protein [Bacillus sp. MM2020_4]|uniref:CBO0543 family protein n=2 Tax=Bacillaceae TaxID=186817 RepID=UPI0014076BF3|nr:CBO0543 family protein [Bacillus sp. MM2020_4]NHC21183.1 hypothetical protein [Bacillus sp. MM2020_4]
MKYKAEKTIEISSWIIVSLLLIKCTPKNKIRETLVVFLFKQALTWIFGLLVVEKNLISYPYRLFFKKANKANFSFEYFIYPGLCALFSLYYPKNKSNLLKTLHFFISTSVIVIFEIIAVKYTKLIKYKKWTWYWSFITIWITDYVTHAFHKWFFKTKFHE